MLSDPGETRNEDPGEIGVSTSPPDIVTSLKLDRIQSRLIDQAARKCLRHPCLSPRP